MIICVNGKFLSKNDANISALDNGFLYGDGIYDTMRTYQGMILEHDLHMQRVVKSTRRIGIKMPWTTDELRDWSKKMVRVNNIKDARVRITVSRGLQGFYFQKSDHPTLVITCEDIAIGQKIYKKGVSAVMMQLVRILPEIKTIGLTHMIVAYRALSQKVYEAILIDHNNFVREGASTNVFMVQKGKLITPQKNILPGLTRKRVIALARKMGMKTLVKDFKIPDLLNADEIFLTNRPREIIPVIRLNGKVMGSGKVGNMTKKIMSAYQEYIQNYLRIHT